MNLPRHLLVAFFTTIMLVGCDTNESSQLREATYEPASQPNPTEKAEVIGDVLGIPEAKPARDSDEQELLGVHSQPLLYSDAGLIVALQGEVTVADGAQISKTLWRQVSGPEAQILNSTQQQAQVIIPHVTKVTDLEFAFAAADTSNRVAEARTRIRVSPLEFSGIIAQSASVVSTGLVTITFSLPETPQTAVTLQYRTQDGSALAGRDYESAQGQVTLTQENPHATIEITALNSDVVSGDLYFIVNYSVEPNGSGTNLYVALPAEREGTEPVEPTDPEPMPTTYSVTYKAGQGGRIQGNAEQILAAGENSSSVTAIAEPGYRFIGWSDGLVAATRIETEITTDLQLAAEFRRNELWLATGHHGNLSIDAGPTTATIDWPAEEGNTYNLIVTTDPETEIQNYSVYGAKLLANVTPPLDIAELTTDQPVYIALQEDGVLKAWSSFVPRVLGTDGSVQTITIDTDGTRYFGGGFTQVSPITGSGVALASNSDHSSHALAGPTIEGEVHAVVSDGYGGWYVGGRFTKVNNEESSYLVHIDAAGQLTGWDPQIQGPVYAIAVDNDTIYVGGNFQHLKESRRNLAAFDRHGQLLPWKPDTYHIIHTVAISEGVIYTGGASGSESFLEAFDKQGRTLPWNPRVAVSGLRAYVYDIGVNDDVIYVAGHFSHANNEPRENLAAFDKDGNLLPWNPRANSSVEALVIDGDVIYIGGDFVQVGDEARTKLAAINTQGQLLPWNPEISGSTVRTMIVHKESIYVGGYFSHAAGEKRNKLAAFDKLGHVLPWKPPTSDSGVSAIAAGEEAIYAGGGFTMIGGGYRTGMAALDINGRLLPWRPEISGTVFGGNPSIKSLLIENDILYAGGHFLKAGDETRNHLAAFDKRGKLLPWNPQLDFVAMVNKLYRADDIIYVVGGLLWADSRASYGLEAFDTEGQLQTWAPVISDEVKAILIDSGVMYANKQFFQDGILTGSFESPENFYLETLALEGDVIYAGGQFVHVGHQGRAGLAAFSLDGNVLSWAPQLSGTVQFAAPGVYTLATNMNLIYVGGSFTSANGEIRGHIASFDPEGNLTPWHTSVDYPVNILTIHDGEVYAGGGFTKAGDQTRRGLATFDLLGNLLNK